MNSIQSNEQNQNNEVEHYRTIQEEMVEEIWFEEGERISNMSDPREIFANRWAFELSL